MLIAQENESRGSERAGQAEMARVDHEASAVDRRCRELRLAMESLVQRELALMCDLDRAVLATGPKLRPLADIAVELGSVRLGLGELDRLVRDAERRRSELQRRAMDLGLAMSIGRGPARAG